MRQLALPQPSRAVVVSACAHAVLLPVIFAAGGLGRTLQPQGPIIQAELVALTPSQPAGVAAPSSTDREPQEASSPSPSVERVEAAERASPAPPPAATPAAEPVQADSAEASADRPAEPVAAAAPATTFVLEDDVDSAPAVAVEEAIPRVVDSAAAPEGAESRQRPLDAENERVLRRLSSWTGRIEPDAEAPTMQWRQDGQEFRAVLRKLPGEGVMGMEQIAVDVTTEREGERLQTELRMTRLAFSSFAQFVDRWDRDVQIHDDEIDGRFHSNSEIKIGRGDRVEPIFRGKVTLAARSIDTLGGGRLNRKTMFPAGIETSVRRIDLPQRAVALDSLGASARLVQRFEHDATITFYADGSYGWRDTVDGAAEQRHALTADPHYLLGGKDVTLHVAGTVNGTVLVYAEDRIVIVDDLRYAVDPLTAEADDFLGLVAERVVEIGEPRLTGPGDLEVHASIYARRQFAVRSYLSRRTGTLRIVGSVAAGSLTATEPRYSTKIIFDERLTKMRAPGFPLSDRYELATWSGEWRSAPSPLD